MTELNLKKKKERELIDVKCTISSPENLWSSLDSFLPAMAALASDEMELDEAREKR